MQSQLLSGGRPHAVAGGLRAASSPAPAQVQRACTGGGHRRSVARRCKGDEKSEQAGNAVLKNLAKASGVSLGPISLSFGDDFDQATQEAPVAGEDNGGPAAERDASAEDEGLLKRAADAAGVSLGPISLSYGDDFSEERSPRDGDGEEEGEEASPAQSFPSINDMTTAEWREQYESNGAVDLWVEEEFNAGSRLVGGRDVHKGGVYGFRTGEGPSTRAVPVHKVTIHNHYADQIVEVDVPEDRYVLWEAEDEGLELPYACRMGCCTACAVRVVEGEMYQPQALGVSEELKERGYALMCVGYPRTDLKLETVPEDEVYDLQFGHTFEARATNKQMASIDRDDFALELADMDE